MRYAKAPAAAAVKPTPRVLREAAPLGVSVDEAPAAVLSAVLDGLLPAGDEVVGNAEPRGLISNWSD